MSDALRTTLLNHFKEDFAITGVLRTVGCGIGLPILLLRLDVFCKIQCTVIRDGGERVYLRVGWQQSDSRITGWALTTLVQRPLRSVLSSVYSSAQRQQQRCRAMPAGKALDASNCLYDFVEDGARWRKELRRIGGRICPYYRPFLHLVPDHVVRSCLTGDDRGYRLILRQLDPLAETVYEGILRTCGGSATVHAAALRAAKVTPRARFVPVSNTLLSKYRNSVVYVYSPLNTDPITSSFSQDDGVDSDGVRDTSQCAEEDGEADDTELLAPFSLLLSFVALKPPHVGTIDGSIPPEVVRTKSLYPFIPADSPLGSPEGDDKPFALGMIVVLEDNLEENDAVKSQGQHAAPHSLAVPVAMHTEELMLTPRDCEGLAAPAVLPVATTSSPTGGNSIPYPLAEVEQTISALHKLYADTLRATSESFLQDTVQELRAATKVTFWKILVTWIRRATRACAVGHYCLLMPVLTTREITRVPRTNHDTGEELTRPTLSFCGVRRAASTLRGKLMAHNWPLFTLIGEQSKDRLITSHCVTDVPDDRFCYCEDTNGAASWAVLAPVVCRCQPDRFDEDGFSLLTQPRPNPKGGTLPYLSLLEVTSTWSPSVPFTPLQAEEWLLGQCWPPETILDVLFLPLIVQCMRLYDDHGLDEDCVNNLLMNLRVRLHCVLTDSEVMEHDEFLGDALVEFLSSMDSLTGSDAFMWRGKANTRASSNKELAMKAPRVLRDYVRCTTQQTSTKCIADYVEALFGALAMVFWVQPLTAGVSVPFRVLHRCAIVFALLLGWKSVYISKSLI